MRKIDIFIFMIVLAVKSFAGITISPADFEFNLNKSEIREFTIVNIGHREAKYKVSLDADKSINKALLLAREDFKLKPGEKKKIYVKVNPQNNLDNIEHRASLKVMEIQETGETNYEFNTTVRLFAYVGEIPQNFEISEISKDERGRFGGDIFNRSERKIEILIEGYSSSEKRIFARKIKILRGGYFDLEDLEMDLEEREKISTLVISTKDMQKRTDLQ